MKGSCWARSLPPDPPPCASSADVARSLWSRHEAILDTVRDDLLLPIDWRPVTSSDGVHTVVVYVSADALAIGEADDFLRFEVTAILAQQIADILGCSLSTPKIEDMSWTQADIRLEPQLMPANAQMSSTRTMIEYNRRVEVARAGRAGLIRTVGKQWVLCRALDDHPMGIHGAVNDGFNTTAPVHEYGPFANGHGFVEWQTPGSRHNDEHEDESQTFTPVRGDCLVDGVPTPFEDVLRSSALAHLVSYDGALRLTRQPGVPRPVADTDPAPPPEAA